MNVAAPRWLLLPTPNLSFLGTHEIVRLPLCEETGSEQSQKWVEKNGREKHSKAASGCARKWSRKWSGETHRQRERERAHIRTCLPDLTQIIIIDYCSVQINYTFWSIGIAHSHMFLYRDKSVCVVRGPCLNTFQNTHMAPGIFVILLLRLKESEVSSLPDGCHAERVVR